jgi:hypothetical protein
MLPPPKDPPPLRTLLLALAAVFTMSTFSLAADQPGQSNFYELRIYTTLPGRLDALNKRFREHTTKLFEKHGITNVGYFTPLEDQFGRGTKLYYLLAYPSKEAREKSWKEFQADPEWKAARADSEKDGPILVKGGVQSIFLTPTQYSMFNWKNTDANRVFSLRIYTTPDAQKLEQLHDRFAKHTIKLFEKHGMTNVAYFSPAEEKDHKDTTLIYFLAFPSVEAHAKSFAEFRTDPEWMSVKASYEKDGSLTIKPAEAGVKDILLTPTDYSPLK